MNLDLSETAGVEAERIARQAAYLWEGRGERARPARLLNRFSFEGRIMELDVRLREVVPADAS